MTPPHPAPQCPPFDPGALPLPSGRKSRVACQEPGAPGNYASCKHSPAAGLCQSRRMPGLAWPGKARVSDKRGQPSRAPLSCPGCLIPGARVTPGESRGWHVQQDTGLQVAWPWTPGGQVHRQLPWAARTWDGAPPSQAWSPARGARCRGLQRASQASKEKSGEGAGSRKGLREGRGRESKTRVCFSSRDLGVHTGGRCTRALR